MSSPHIVKAFDQELHALTRHARTMGEFAGKQFADATRALLHGDGLLAKSVIENDGELDALRTELSKAAATVIAKRQPLAMDLEEVLATIRIAQDLERVGDQAKNIAKRAAALTDARLPANIIEALDELARLTAEQLKEALDTFEARDGERALVVCRQDEKIDELYTSIFHTLVASLSADPGQAVGYVHLLFCAKNIERIGDHATHIAQAAYLIATGRQLEPARQGDTQ